MAVTVGMHIHSVLGPHHLVTHSIKLLVGQNISFATQPHFSGYGLAAFSGS